MATPDASRDLRQALKFLRNAAPEEFRNFLVAFEIYKSNQVLAAAMAPQAEVLTVQGHARQCIALADMINEADNARTA